MNWRCSLARGRRCLGLSLIEVLVVIGIVAVLIALLVGIARNARRVSTQAKCLSNLRGIFEAYQAYANDNGGYFPLNDSIQSSTSTFDLHYVDAALQKVLTQQYGMAEGVSNCPAIEVWPRTDSGIKYGGWDHPYSYDHATVVPTGYSRFIWRPNGYYYNSIPKDWLYKGFKTKSPTIDKMPLDKSPLPLFACHAAVFLKADPVEWNLTKADNGPEPSPMHSMTGINVIEIDGRAHFKRFQGLNYSGPGEDAVRFIKVVKEDGSDRGVMVAY